MPLVIAGATSGSITVTTPAVAGSNTATLPAATGTVMVSGNMPAFSAYSNAIQSITTSTFTKVAINTEEFDTANCFDSTTNYRFTPTVAGYYQVNGTVRCTGTSATQMLAIVYKNGAAYARGNDLVFSSSTLANFNALFSEVIYMNGTTDYLELYGYITATTPTFGYGSSSATSRFSACLVRAA